MLRRWKAAWRRGVHGIVGEVLEVLHMDPRHGHVVSPGGEAVAKPESAQVAFGSNTVRAGQEGN